MEVVTQIRRCLIEGAEAVSKATALLILNEVTKRLRACGNVLDFDLQERKVELILCGDTHGQAFDVLNIFETIGEPDENRWYLFNGDIVDRGIFGTELALLLLAYKVARPNSIHFTRGNHESRGMTKAYGFKAEVLFKYDSDVYNKFMECFDCFPLAATISVGKVKALVVHGGLFSDSSVTLDSLRSIDRFQEPTGGGPMHDLLWSDPQEVDGRTFNRQRGGGLRFGPDVTRHFLVNNGLNLLIRSHEVRNEGFSVEQGGLLMTLFSAPNYCDSMGNKGAIIRFTDEEDALQIVQFEAAQHPDIDWIKQRYHTVRSKL